MLKRVFDICLSSAALIALAPGLVLVAFAVRANSPGPSLFFQTRVGKGGKTFRMAKFRTMALGSEKTGGFQTNENDPRVTTVGAFLRRTSIDELPQLWNVLIGDMSIVGPRPDVPEQRELYTEQQFDARHSVRPGLTGLAQVRGRNFCTARQRTRYDLFYVKHAGVSFDLRIVVWTFAQLMKQSY